MSADPAQRLLTARQVCDEFFPADPVIDERWVARHIPRVRLSERVTRYRYSAVVAFIAAREAA